MFIVLKDHYLVFIISFAKIDIFCLTTQVTKS